MSKPRSHEIKSLRIFHILTGTLFGMVAPSNVGWDLTLGLLVITQWSYNWIGQKLGRFNVISFY